MMVCHGRIMLEGLLEYFIIATGGYQMSADRSRRENKIRHLLDVYIKVYNHLNQSHAHYFQRTQILMFAIQGGLIAAFIKLLTIGKLKNNTILSSLDALYFVLLAISALGIIFCFIWLSMIQRHWDVLEYSRCYLRYIEGQLMKLGVPLAIFRVESAIFFRKRHIFFGNRYEEGRNHFFQKKFPYEENREAKIGLIKESEASVVRIIRLVWAICFSIFLYQILNKWEFKIFEYMPIYLSATAAAIIVITIYILIGLDRFLIEKKDDFWLWLGFNSLLFVFSIILVGIKVYSRNISPEILLGICIITSIVYTIIDWKKENKKDDNKDNKYDILFDDLGKL